MVHTFGIRDLPALRMLANRGVSFDSPTCLTEELHLLRSAILAQLFPGLLPETLVLNRHNSGPGIGQLGHRLGDASSRLRYIAPREIFKDDRGIELIEALLSAAGYRQAQHILADAQEKSDECGFLRRAGFSVYSRREIWKGAAPFAQPDKKPKGVFRPLLADDAPAAHALYCSVVPALVHQVEGFPRRPKGWMIFEEGELVGIFNLRTGSRGIWMEPLFHPGAHNAAEWIAYWLGGLQLRPQDPVYLCVRSYQDWIGPILQDSGLSMLNRQAVLIRRVVIPLPLPESIPLSAVEKTVPQATTYSSSVTQNAYDSPTANHR
jgi:hypothetical protein